VTSYSSSLPEVVGETAVQLSPHDQNAWTTTLQNLVADPAWRAQLVAAGYRRARQFSWQKAAQELLSLYQALLHPR